MPQSYDTWSYRTFKLQIHAKVIESEQEKKTFKSVLLIF